MDDARELTLLRERITFQERLDEFLEAAVIHRSSLQDMLAEVLPLVRQTLRAERVWLETLDEELAPRVFGDAPPDAAGATQALGRGRAVRLSGDGRTLLARRLDVAGESYGLLGAELAGASDHDDLAARETLLAVAAEELDDHLADVRNARQKQRVVRAVHDALRHPLVHEGVRIAVERMSEQVTFDLMIVLYHLQEDYTDTLHYLVFRGHELEFSTGAHVAGELDRLLRQGNMTRPGGAPFLVRGAEVEHRRVAGDVPASGTKGGTARLDLRDERRTDELLGALGYRECVENVLIAGLDDEAVVGRRVRWRRAGVLPLCAGPLVTSAECGVT